MSKIAVDELTFISKEDVPQKRTSWDEIFNAIPKGQALVVENAQARGERYTISHAQHVRAALRRRHEKGRFTHLRLVVRDNKSYVINEQE